MKKSRNLFESFLYAISGLIYAFKTQRNIRIHFFIAIVVLIFSRYLNLTNFELLSVILSITLVITAEMINTAIEATIDLITRDYHPLARIAKNVAAGAVLITAINAVIVAYFVFFQKIQKVLF
ncbi:MAG: diacylglycerol kinase family protein [Thermovenabulum sp.]|uniref:diacylglycerol kinase family protein n=1 Tax=Thermovenabulum sp. TaxID=3100335 RepID=UPI003C7A3DA7